MISRQGLLERIAGSIPLILPSILKCDFGNLHHEVELLEAGGAKILHMDVMDGHFVPNLTYGPVVIERVRDLTELPFEAHLMISDPARYLDDFLKAGCNLITFHLEAVPEAGPLLRRIRDKGALAGLAINPALTTSSLLVDRHGRTRAAEAFGWMSTALGAGTAAGSAAAGALAQHSGLAPSFLCAAGASFAGALLAVAGRRRLRDGAART